MEPRAYLLDQNPLAEHPFLDKAAFWFVFRLITLVGEALLAGLTQIVMPDINL
jgi:hypothetical protein